MAIVITGGGKREPTRVVFLKRAEKEKAKHKTQKFSSLSLSPPPPPLPHSLPWPKKLHLLFSHFFLSFYSSPKPSEFMMASLSLSAILSFVA